MYGESLALPARPTWSHSMADVIDWPGRQSEDEGPYRWVHRVYASNAAECADRVIALLGIDPKHRSRIVSDMLDSLAHALWIQTAKAQKDQYQPAATAAAERVRGAAAELIAAMHDANEASGWPVFGTTTDLSSVPSNDPRLVAGVHAIRRRAEALIGKPRKGAPPATPIAVRAIYGRLVPTYEETTGLRASHADGSRYRCMVETWLSAVLPDAQPIPRSTLADMLSRHRKMPTKR